MDIAKITTQFETLYGIDLTGESEAILLQDAINKIGELYPKVEKSSLLTVAEQTSYSIEHENVIALKAVYYDRQRNISPFENSSLIPNGNDVKSLSRQFTDIMEGETFDRLNPVGAVINDATGFDLLPTPTQDDIEVHYEYARYRTIAEIPEMFKDDLTKLFFNYQAKNAQFVAMKDSGGNQFNFDRMGNIGVGSDGKKTQSEKLDDELKSIEKGIRNKILGLPG